MVVVWREDDAIGKFHPDHETPSAAYKRLTGNDHSPVSTEDHGDEFWDFMPDGYIVVSSGAAESRIYAPKSTVSVEPVKTIGELFKLHNDEFLEFDRIPTALRLHPRPDVCAMLYMHNKFGGDGRAIVWAGHDEIAFDWDGGRLTEVDVIYLVRCGVRHSDDKGLCMYV